MEPDETETRTCLVSGSAKNAQEQMDGEGSGSPPTARPSEGEPVARSPDLH